MSYYQSRHDVAGREFPYRLGTSFEAEFPGADAVSTECVINLIVAAQLIEALVSPTLRARGLSIGTVNVLEILRGAREPLPPSVISARLLVTRATVTALVDSLERRGLVRRAPHPRDRRMLLVEITSAGEDALAAFMPWLHLAERDWAADLGDAEKERLLSILGKLQRRLESQRLGQTKMRTAEVN